VDKPVFILEMPELNDEAVAGVQDFLWELIRSFESQYYHQLQRYHRRSSLDDLENQF
jgi:hypothetical protein